MNDLFFTVKSGLKDIIGKDLITDDNIAVFELVKNSYDANAKNVIIKFEQNKITIADDGKGMSYLDLNNKWLAVAYSAKKDGTEDIEENLSLADEIRDSYRDKIKVRKYYAGAKGIGRFSCDRLGRILLLTTQKINSPIEQLRIDWEKFEKDQKDDFIKVKVPHETLSDYHIHFPLNSEHGTILEIDNATNWSRKRITDLKSSLEKLINPFSENLDFNIEIICEAEKDEDNALKKDGTPKYIEREKVNGRINNSILDILRLKTTQIEVKIKDSIIETMIFDRGTLIYHIKEKNKHNPFIDNLDINLYYLNRSAKMNFTNRMKIEPVNYGSIFLFKNGFRVQPYGNTGDDSWGLDFRAQQGYNRYLGSRDLFGRVDITTDNIEQFKEVSSRDGGLVETVGYNQLKSVFEKVHRRLERYVVGVLWGEAFKKNKYFRSEDEAQKLREMLLEKDKDADNFSIAKSNIGSKIDFIRLIKSLSNEKDVEIIDFNKDLVDLVNENLEIIQPKFIKDLEKIAEISGDQELQQIVLFTEEAYKRIENEKEEAIERAKRAEDERFKADLKTKEEEEKRKQAEQKTKEEEEKRKQAEADKTKAENERLKAENERLKAEKRAKEEEEKRKQTENAKKKVEAELEQETKQGIFQRSIIGREKEQILGLQHQINHSSSRIKNNISNLLKYIDKSKIDDKISKYISIIALESSKIESISNFVTNANFDLKASEIKQDIIQFIEDYINEIYLPDIPVLKSILKIRIENVDKLKHVIEFRPLEITTLIDNFIQNAEKANAKNIFFSFGKIGISSLIINISDDGKGIPDGDKSKLFDLGFTTTNGSGIGLFNVKSVVDRLKGQISVFSENNNGAKFTIEI